MQSWALSPDTCAWLVGAATDPPGEYISLGNDMVTDGREGFSVKDLLQTLNPKP